MSISLRILVGFGLSTLLMVILGVVALFQIGEVRDVTDTIVSRDIAAYRRIDALHDAQDQMAMLRLVATTRFQNRNHGGPGGAAGAPEEAIADWQRGAAQAEADLAGARQSVQSFAGTAQGSERHGVWIALDGLLQTADGQLRRIRTDTEALFAAMRAGDAGAVLGAEAGLTGERVAFDHLMEQAGLQLDIGVRVGQARAGAVYAVSRWVLLLALVLAVLVAVAVTLLIRRSIVGPLGSFAAVIDRVGEGDLSVRARQNGGDEFGRLGGTLNRMVDGLRLIAGESREATENLNVSVAEIRASTQEQAAGVEEQLAAVQETAATVDEITHSGTQITRRAQEVIGSAQATTQASVAGLHAVQETGRAMAQIVQQGEAVAANIVALSEKTQAVGEIVTTVNDISERSHLLALNAAIEAAAAGEHGRSFAVVAVEMKVLADQAKDATTQVRSILGDIQRGINTSVMLTEEAVKRSAAGAERTRTAEATIEEMAAGIQDAVQTFQQIVASTNQQQLGIEQVMAALQNIRQASQQTAAGTRQLDNAATALGTLSQRLLGVAERFRI